MPQQEGQQGAQANWVLEQSKFLSEAELKRLRRITEQYKTEALKKGTRTPVKDWFLLSLATETGLRVQEMADVSCGDLQVNDDCRVVVVRRGKGGKPRLVIVRKEFMRHVTEFLAWKESQDESIEKNAPLFVAGGRRMGKRALQKSYARSMARAGITQPHGVGIHSLRHTYASFLFKASNSNLRLVQRQLGHASVRTTEVYAHVFDPEMKKAVEGLYD